MRARFILRACKARWRDQKLEIATALGTIKRGDLVVDVGTNKGAYLHWLRHAVGVEGQVFGFEPQPKLADYLKSTVISMRWENVRIKQMALSDSTGVKRLHVPGGEVSPGASLEASVLAASPGAAFDCEVDTLDRQLEGQKQLTFLKVDVEGHELAVFRGAAGRLMRDKPLIVFECERRHLSKHPMDDVFEYLKGFDYQGWFFEKNGLRSLDEFDPEIHQIAEKERFWDEPGYFNNFLFRHRSSETTL